ncbi:hypothetical protein LTS14_004188 [Recurvomyces mirabilis]|uniref:uncharacterized protein n=1 Tax=Recurvomyces mirabilis TaxID=574656 RepID=UPI002DDF92EE|nr:hypothetical protein LTS14_004188 [Recurvomyces mirabilis]
MSMAVTRQRTTALIKCLLVASLLFALLVLHHEILPARLTTVIQKRGDEDLILQSTGVVEPPDEMLSAWQANWQKALIKGKARLHELYDADTEQSAWEEYTDLKRYGWECQEGTRPGVHAAVRIPLGVSEDLGGLPGVVGTGKEVYCRHEKPSSNEEDASQHYKPTMGYFLGIYWPESGIIHAQRSVSPATIAKGTAIDDTRLINGFKNAGGGTVVPLATQADVMFLEWQHQCAKSGHENAARNLRLFFRGPVQNDVAQGIILQALRNKGSETGAPPWSKRVQFDIDSQDGQAILGSPNGQSVAYFLSQHRQQLGWKVVKSVEVFDNPESTVMNERFWDSQSLCLVFSISDHGQAQHEAVEAGPAGVEQKASSDLARSAMVPATLHSVSHSEEQQKASDSRRTIRRGDTDAATAGTVGSKLPSNQLKSIWAADWDKARVHGQVRLQELLDPAPPQSPWIQYDELAKYGRTKSEPTWFMPGQIKEAVVEGKNMLGGTGNGGHKVIWSHNEGSQGIPADGKSPQSYEATDASYTSVYWPQGGAILSQYSTSPKYAIKGRPSKEDQQLVPLARQSDVLALEWFRQCDEAQTDPSMLKYFLRVLISNDEVINVIIHVAQRILGEGQIIPEWAQRLKVDAASPDGEALLGTVTGQGVARFLSQHRKKLGWKEVRSIHLFNCKTAADFGADTGYWHKDTAIPGLLFIIGDHESRARGADVRNAEGTSTVVAGRSFVRIDSGLRYDAKARHTSSNVTQVLPRSSSELPKHGLGTIEPPTLKVPDDDLLQSWATLWEKARLKGAERLSELLDPRPQQSPWTEYGELELYGWRKKPVIVQAFVAQLKVAVQRLEEEAGLKEGTRNYDKLAWNHEVPSEIGQGHGKPSASYKVTGASYTAAYSPRAGLIVSQDAVSPTEGARRRKFPPSELIVPLGRQSDVLALEWFHEFEMARLQDQNRNDEQASKDGRTDSEEKATSGVKNLRWIVRGPIANIETRAVIFQALRNQPNSKERYPNGPPQWAERVKIHIKSEDGKALLGTANGQTVARLLSQHHTQLGRKTIDSVHVFNAKNLEHDYTQGGYWEKHNSMPALLFVIVDYDSSQNSGGDTAGKEEQTITRGIGFAKAKL